MTTPWLTLIALLASLSMLAVLAYTDPKRRRNRGIPALRLPLKRKRWQGVLWTLVILPLFPLVATGSFAALLMWLSALTVGGWLLALGFNRLASRH